MLGTIVAIAIEAALAGAGARAELLAVDGAAPAGCAVERAEAARPVTASGRAAVRLVGRDAAGRGCEAWVWARVRVKGPALVTQRAVAGGERLATAVTPVERELTSGRPLLAALPEDARAARALGAGVALEPSFVRDGPLPGEPVTVSLRSGALVVEDRGRAVACTRGRACALLPSGRRLEGAWHGGRIVVDLP